MKNIINDILNTSDLIASHESDQMQVGVLKEFIIAMWDRSQISQIKATLEQLSKESVLVTSEQLATFLSTIELETQKMETVVASKSVQWMEGESGFYWETEAEESRTHFTHRCDAVQDAYRFFGFEQENGSEIVNLPVLSAENPKSHLAESSVNVSHWDKVDAPHTHRIAIIDQRATHGQVFTEIHGLSGDEDDVLMVSMEVSNNPLNSEQAVPCYHLHFDGNQVAASFYKVGSQILMRPETDIRITEFDASVNGVSENLFLISVGTPHPKMHSPVCIAQLESNAFTFTAVGENESKARSALEKGLAVHAKQFDLSANWWEPYDITYLTLNSGGCARDYQVLVGTSNIASTNKNHH